MKNRTWICYALDVLGTIALLGAGFALISALWFAATVPEPMLLIAFKYCLIAAVGAFLAARVCELTRLLRTGTGRLAEQPAVPAPENVEALPAPGHLSRAA